MALLGKILKRKSEIKEAVEKKEVEIKARPSFGKTSEGKEKSNYVPGILISQHVTEKSTTGNILNKYVFKVSGKANKPEIKKAVEGKYGVRVLNVRVLNTKSKQVRLGRIEGTSSGYKKAIVTLGQGDKIEIGV